MKLLALHSDFIEFNLLNFASEIKNVNENSGAKAPRAHFVRKGSDRR
ncbi:hypothetical protein GOV09_03230 [Candidatus Woesearchaeota archaeon]|nr:hypothetical protein [Candidatus Woesearchaeota archaeon]